MFQGRNGWTIAGLEVIMRLEFMQNMKDVEQRSKDTQHSIPLVMMMMILVTRSGGCSTD